MSLAPLGPEPTLMVGALGIVLLQSLPPRGDSPAHAPRGVVVMMPSAPAPLQDLGGRGGGHGVVHGNRHLGREKRKDKNYTD